MIGVSERTLRNWREDRNMPQKPEIIARMAEFFHVRDNFFDEEEKYDPSEILDRVELVENTVESVVDRLSRLESKISSHKGSELKI